MVKSDQIKTIEIERVKCPQLPEMKFRNLFLKPGKPVIIEDCLTNLPISKWTMKYLLDKVGNNKVSVRGKTDSDDYKAGKSYTVRETTVSQYINDILTKKKKSLSSYMAVQNIKKCFPELENESELPKYVEKLHNGPFLWVGRQGHYEYCHYDPDASMLMMIEGKKEVRLYSCSFLHHLYPNELGSKGKTIQSQVICDNPDIEKFPNFSEVTCHHGFLQPGDILFIPAFWWHQVNSLTDSVSANAFFGDSGDANYIERIMLPPVFPAFKYWLLNIVEQNRHFESFTRTLERLPLCLENLVLKHFHEKLDEYHKNILVEVVMEYLELKSLPVFQGGGLHPPPLKVRGLRWR